MKFSQEKITKRQKFNFSFYFWLFLPVMAFLLVLLQYYTQGTEIIWDNIIQDAIWKAALMLIIWIPISWLLLFKLDLLNRMNNILKE